MKIPIDNCIFIQYNMSAKRKYTMKNTILTKRQQEIFDFVIREIRDKGFPPTIAGIREEFSFKSPTAVNDHLSAIEKKGYIKRHSHTSRGIEVIRNTENGNKKPRVMDNLLSQLLTMIMRH